MHTRGIVVKIFYPPAPGKLCLRTPNGKLCSDFTRHTRRQPKRSDRERFPREMWRTGMYHSLAARWLAHSRGPGI